MIDSYVFNCSNVCIDCTYWRFLLVIALYLALKRPHFLFLWIHCHLLYFGSLLFAENAP